MKLSKEQFLFLFSEENIFKGLSTEVSFYLEGDSLEKECWLGKMPDPNGAQRDIYWICLEPAASKGYYYDDLYQFLHAKIFDGKSIIESVDKIWWESLEGSKFEEMLPYYLKDL